MTQPKQKQNPELRHDTALLLIDVQEDYLAREGLTPAREQIVANAAELLEAFRGASAPIAHLRTLVDSDGANAMPHRRQNPICVLGTAGAEAPAELQELPGELVLAKPFFSGFSHPQLAAWLHERGITRVVLAGLYTHVCVRETAIDAYEAGFEVLLASEAIASERVTHASAALEWLTSRVATMADTTSILRGLENAANEKHDSARFETMVFAATRAQLTWELSTYEQRRALLLNWADELERRREDIAKLITAEVRKPILLARDEVSRALAHLKTAVNLPSTFLFDETAIAEGVRVRHRPLGVVAVLMPWNNPLALPVSKIAPALMAGNAVLFKPAPEAERTAQLILETLSVAGMPEMLVQSSFGGVDAGKRLIRSPHVRGVTITGSIEAGQSIARECVLLTKPVQAELGGNNAAIVLADANLTEVVPALVRNAFSYSGQRCTALRRFIVAESILDEFIAQAKSAIAGLRLGDPADTATDVGPLVSARAAARVQRTLAETSFSATEILAGNRSFVQHDDHFIEPTLVLTRDPKSAIVQEETFGPVAVIQPAATVDEAIALANGVRQGLLMAVCTSDAEVSATIAQRAEVGIVQHGANPVPVHPDAPFGGWKASGIGSPEHGIWDLQFFLRPQTTYGHA